MVPEKETLTFFSFECKEVNGKLIPFLHSCEIKEGKDRQRVILSSNMVDT